MATQGDEEGGKPDVQKEGRIFAGVSGSSYDDTVSPAGVAESSGADPPDRHPQGTASVALDSGQSDAQATQAAGKRGPTCCRHDVGTSPSEPIRARGGHPDQRRPPLIPLETLRVSDCETCTYRDIHLEYSEHSVGSHCRCWTYWMYWMYKVLLDLSIMATNCRSRNRCPNAIHPTRRTRDDPCPPPVLQGFRPANRAGPRGTGKRLKV